MWQLAPVYPIYLFLIYRSENLYSLYFFPANRKSNIVFIDTTKNFIRNLKKHKKILTLKNPFFSGIWVVFVNRFERLSRNFLSVVRSLFAQTSKFRDFWSFFQNWKKNSKIRKKSEKIRKYLEKLTNQFWLKRVRLPVFFVKQFFFTHLSNSFLELLICKINVLSTYRIVDFFHIFILLGSIRNTLWISLFAGNVTIHPS